MFNLKSNGSRTGTDLHRLRSSFLVNIHIIFSSSKSIIHPRITGRCWRNHADWPIADAWFVSLSNISLLIFTSSVTCTNKKSSELAKQIQFHWNHCSHRIRVMRIIRSRVYAFRTVLYAHSDSNFANLMSFKTSFKSIEHEFQCKRNDEKEKNLMKYVGGKYHWPAFTFRCTKVQKKIAA